MLNAVGRDIPEEVLKETGKTVFQGSKRLNGAEYKKASVPSHARIGGSGSKVEENLTEVLQKCNAHDGMTISFHHHFREGDLVAMQVMHAIHDLGLKNIRISASSLSKAQDDLVPMIEDGTVSGIETSGVRGKIGDAISRGALQEIAILRSHGGRVRAIESGETKSTLPSSAHRAVMHTEIAAVSAERVTAAYFPMRQSTRNTRNMWLSSRIRWFPFPTSRQISA